MGASTVGGTVDGVDTFDEIMENEPGLSRHMGLMARCWEETAEGVSLVREVAEARRLVTGVTTSFSAAASTVVLDCGTLSLSCRPVPPRRALKLARLAAGEGVLLRVARFEAALDGWELTVTAHCGTPFPFGSVVLPMRSVHIERHPGRHG